MKDVHGEHISHGATGQRHGRSPFKESGQREQGSSVQRWTQRAAGSTLPLRGRLGSAGLGRWGRSWHLMDRLYVFSGECRSNQKGEFPTLLQPLYWEYSLTTLQPPKHSKAGKRRALAADQQDIFTVKESICYCELASVSSRMFGNPSGTFLALRLSDIPLHLIFSLM